MSATAPPSPALAQQSFYAAGFVQDQWKVTQNLTVNLGVLVNRDEYIPSGGTFVFMSGDFTIPNSVAIPTCGLFMSASVRPVP